MTMAIETISLDFLKSSRIVVTLVQGETQSRTLHFVLTEDGKPLDLTNKTVTFYMVKQDGTEYFDSASVASETAPEGIAELTLGIQASSCFGWAKTELRVADKSGAVLKSTDLRIFVKSSESEKNLESTDEFHALDAALAQAAKASSAAVQAVASATDLVKTADGAAQSAQAALATAESISQSAASAANTANAAASSANTEAAAAQAAAQAASTAADSANTAASKCNETIGNVISTTDAEIKKLTDKAGGVASYDNSVQSATFGSLTVPKSGTTLQIPAAVRDVGQITQDIFNNAEIGYSYIGSVGPDLSGIPLSQWGTILCCASGILCEQVIFYNNNIIYSRYGFGGTFSAFSKISMS